MNKMILRFDESDAGMASSPQRKGIASELDLSAVITAVRRQKPVMVVAIIAALALGILHILNSPRHYMASSQVMIGEGVAGVGELTRTRGFDQNEIMLESAIKVLESQNIALAVVDELNLHQNPSFMTPERSLVSQSVQDLRALIAGGFAARPAVQDLLPPEVQDMQLRMAAADALREEIDVRREGRSSVFSIRYSSSDPELAAVVVNAYGEAFVSDQLIGNVEASARVLDWLQDRLLVIQDNSRQAALEAELYRARNGLLTVSGESLTARTISQLYGDLAAATVELARVRALSRVYGELRDLDPVRFVDSGAPGARILDAEFSEGRQRLHALLQRKEQVERQYGADHLQAVQLRSQIEMEGLALKREIQRMYETSLNATRAVEAEVEMLRSSIAEISAENLDLAVARVELRALEKQAEIFDALNESYLLRLKDLEQTQTFPVTNVRVLSVADTPEDPYAPRKSLIMGFMLALGTLAGSGVALLRERNERFIRTKQEIIDAVGQPFLGYLPLLTLSETQGPAVPAAYIRRPRQSETSRQSFKYSFASLKNPRSQFTETLRNIRIAYETAAGGKPSYVLGVISVRPGEGKTTVAANFAGLAAAAGRSVLLLDADVRTSGMSRMLRQSLGAGLREVLLGRDSWKAAIRRETITGLNFLPSNFPKDDPVAGDIAGSPELRNTIQEMRKSYSLTVVDLAPLGPVADARALLPVIDGLVMVVEWGRLSRDLLQETLMSDPLLHEKLLGITLNKTNMNALRKYTAFEAPGEYYNDDAATKS